MTILNDAIFPLDASYGTSGGDRFRTEIEQLSSGAEQRNSVWAQGLARWNVRVGRKQIGSLERLRHFHRRMKGRAYGFRFADPIDYQTGPFGGENSATDQVIGLSDGIETRFRFAKSITLDGYTETRITRRVRADSVLTAIDGAPVASGFTIDDVAGWLIFDAPPVAGASITAGWRFDRAARFASDVLDITVDGYQQGLAASITINELREDDA